MNKTFSAIRQSIIENTLLLLQAVETERRYIQETGKVEGALVREWSTLSTDEKVGITSPLMLLGVKETQARHILDELNYAI